MRFIITLSIVLIAFDAIEIRRIKQALLIQKHNYHIYDEEIIPQSVFAR
jgi:hypothetical protein